MNDTTDPILDNNQDASADAMTSNDEGVTDNFNDEQVQAEALEPENTDPRLAALEAKAQRNHAPEEEPEVIPEVHQEPDLPVHMGEDGIAYVRTKVAGEEGEVPLSKVLAAFQKDAAGDKKLREAATRQLQLDARERELQQQLQPPPGVEAPNALSGQDVQPEGEDQLETFKNALLYDDADAAEKVRSLLSKNNTQQPANPLDTTQVARDVIAINEQQAQIDAVRNDENYSDIFTDPAAMRELNGYSGMLRDNEPGLSVEENLRKAGDMYKMRTGTYVAPNVEPNPETFQQQRRGAKRVNASRNVPAGNQRAQVSAPTQQPETKAQILAQMRQERAQAG